MGSHATLHLFQISAFLSMQVFGQTPIYISSTGQWNLWPELPSHLVRKCLFVRREKEGRAESRGLKELSSHDKGHSLALLFMQRGIISDVASFYL